MGSECLVDDLPRSQLEVDEAQGIQPTLPVHGSLAEGLAARFDSFSGRPCLGQRTGDAYRWISYGRVYSAAKKISGALQSKLAPGSLVGICGVNSLNWFLADLAAVFAGVGSVPLSEDWDLAKLRPVVERCELSAVFCDGSQLPKCLALPSLRWIIVLDGHEHVGESVEGMCHIVSMDSLAVAQPEMPIKVRGPSDVHTILHTSGTTGLPKGVVYSDDLWHKNMLMYPGLNVGYSYMPLAYITDRHTVYTALWNGGRVGIRTPGSTDEIFRDLQALRPTVLKGVPAFWERVQRAARLVQDRSLRLLGGRCRVLICGAGALDASVADWFRSCALDTGPVEFLEMYGGTECGNIAVNRRINKDIEYKVLPYEDMEPGSGELVVKTGSHMFSCYYKDPDRTAAAFTEDGFYKIGDLVRVEGDQIEVIGRAKSSIKLATGKWVFPESLEIVYRTELDAENVRHVFVHGDLHHDSLVAVVDAESKNLDPQQLLQKLRSRSPAPLCAVLLAEEPFSQEAGMLNGTGKLDRTRLLSIYGAAIEEELQRSAATAARASLGELDAAQSFKTQGGTSLQAARIARLYLELGVPMSRAVQLLLSDEPVDHVRSQLEEVDAMADSKLGLPKPQVGQRREDTEYTLLTGGTGMVGRYILAELLDRRRPVLCLVRAASEHQGRQRLAHALTQCGRYRPEWWQQLVVSTASLAKPLDLNRSVKDVIHAAAKVDLKAPYAAHRTANVLGTFNVLSYAATVGARVLFISTTDVYKDKAQADACAVDPVEEVLKDARHGYAASKAVGEALVAQALRQGCPLQLLKPVLRIHLALRTVAVWDPKTFETQAGRGKLAADGNAREVLVAPPQDTGDQEPCRDKAQCRFCLETGGDDLIAPCMCKGHSKWVHGRCLDKWRSEGRGARSFTHCPTCHFAYLMELKRAPTETEQHVRERRRAILRRAVGQFFLGAVLVQVLLCLVAFLIRLCDPSSELVRLMPFFTPLLPDEDARSYLDTFRFHKSTYYFASLVLSLATVGVVTVLPFHIRGL
ncbi:car [Symbiodinium sp. KB8]|nr:car [Symbiodinium sp. KB8]